MTSRSEKRRETPLIVTCLMEYKLAQLTCGVTKRNLMEDPWRTIFGDRSAFQELSFGQAVWCGFEKCTHGVVYVYVHEFD